MTKKPWHFTILSLFLIASSLSIPWQVTRMHGLHPWNDIDVLVSQIEIWGWVFMGLSLLNAYLMLMASPKLVWSVPSLCLYTGLMNAFAIQSTPSMTALSVAVVTIGFYLPFGLLFMPEPISLLKNPENKWWSHPERKRIHVPMIIDAPYNQAFSVSTYDISLGGTYIRFDDVHTSMNLSGLTGKRSGLKVGDLLNLKIHMGRFKHIYCQGRVVRLQKQAKGQYPEGIGIQFLHMKKRDQRRLKQLIYSKTLFKKNSKTKIVQEAS